MLVLTNVGLTALRAQLISRLLTMTMRKPYRYVTSNPDKLSLAILPWVDTSIYHYVFIHIQKYKILVSHPDRCLMWNLYSFMLKPPKKVREKITDRKMSCLE